MIRLILFLALLFCKESYGQISLKSPKHTYSLTIPENWYLTDNKEVDIFLTDGTGSSFSVGIAEIPEVSLRTAKQEFEVVTNSQLEEAIKNQLKFTGQGKINLKERGSIKISDLEFYFFHFTITTKDNVTLLFKSYYRYSLLNAIEITFSCRNEDFNIKKHEAERILASIKMTDPLLVQHNFFELQKKFDDLVAAHSKKKLQNQITRINEGLEVTDKDRSNDIWDGNNYRNTKYKFRVSFPKNWEYERGTSAISLARSINREKGGVMLVGVKHLPKGDKYIVSNQEYKKGLIELLSMQNLTPEDIELKDGYLNNFPAKLLSLKSLEKSGTRVEVYISKQVHCVIEDKLYNLTLNIPIEEFNDEIELLWNRFIASFKFEFGY